MTRLILCLLCSCVPAFATTYSSDGSPASVTAKIALCVSGDTVTIPGSTFTWNTTVTVNKAITIQGVSGSTVINGTATCFQCDTVNGWRITGITRSSSAGYFVYFFTYGLIDTCVINGNSGSDEFIFGYGPSDSWQTANSLGTANAVYVEDCVFNSPGYTDFNANARGVVRFCTINDDPNGIKIDAHGLASNTPPRGVRQMEIYGNSWNKPSGFDTHIEVRGGTAMIFDNVSANTSYDGFFLTDYGYLNQWPNFGSVFMTPDNYPIGDQVGTGQDVTVAAASIVAKKMYRIATVGSTNFVALGASANTVGVQFISTGSGSGSGTATTSPAATEPAYVWHNLRNGSVWVRNGHTAAAGAFTLYGSSFGDENLILMNRDVFGEAGFDVTATGVGRGTTAAMNAYTPSVVGYGWWVTDQGSWNTNLAANTSGRLYRWDGAAWVLYYTPYTYPHPGRGPPVGGVAAIPGTPVIIGITP